MVVDSIIVNLCNLSIASNNKHVCMCIIVIVISLSGKKGGGGKEGGEKGEKGRRGGGGGGRRGGEGEGGGGLAVLHIAQHQHTRPLPMELVTYCRREI